MRQFRSTVLLLILLVVPAFAQQPAGTPVRSQEVSEVYGIPVLIKHLPEWKSVESKATFATDAAELRRAIGERPVLDLVEFSGGTEAVTAPYPQGSLLIIEYPTPQMASEADAKFSEYLAAGATEPPVIYRRIGNYSVFVFDAADQAAGTALLEQVKYEKSVQWLGEDPFLYQRFERYFAVTTRDVAIATVLWIVSGFGLAIALGVLCGYLFFLHRERTRARGTAYSDAGGLTRLNLDDLSEPVAGE